MIEAVPPPLVKMPEHRGVMSVVKGLRRLVMIKNRVLVRVEEGETMSGDIEIPEDAVRFSQWGEVIAVGPGYRVAKTGARVPCTVRRGDRVSLLPQAGRLIEFRVGAWLYRIVDEREIELYERP